MWPLLCKWVVCGIVTFLFFAHWVIPSFALLLHTLVVNERFSRLVKKGTAQSVAVVVVTFFATLFLIAKIHWFELVIRASSYSCLFATSLVGAFLFCVGCNGVMRQLHFQD